MYQLIETRYLGIFSVICFTASLIYLKFLKKNYVYVGKVKELYIYPIKGVQGIPVNYIEVTKFGLKYENIKDRMFSFIDEKNRMVNMMIVAKIGTISLQLLNNKLLAKCNGDCKNEELTIEIPIKKKLESTDEIEEGEFKGRKISGIICDKSINDFFSNYLGIKVKLLQHLPELKYRPANSVNKIDINEEKKYNILFQNYVDFHLISEQSLQLLNEKIVENSGNQFQVSGRNFRPNMFVTDTECAFHEDKWKFIRFQENKTKFVQIENCFRCANTTIEDANRKEPIYTLRKFRRHKLKSEDKRVNYSPFFGCLLGTLNEGIIRLNDKIEAVLVDVI